MHFIQIKIVPEKGLIVPVLNRYKVLEPGTRYKVPDQVPGMFDPGTLYLVPVGQYKVQSTWPKVSLTLSGTKVPVLYLVPQIQVLYLTQL